MVRGGKIGPIRWANPVRPKLGSNWAIKLLARKKLGQIWLGSVWPSPVWPGPPRPARIFFTLKRLFGPTGPVLGRAELLKLWSEKIGPILTRLGFGPPQPGPPDYHLYMWQRVFVTCYCNGHYIVYSRTHIDIEGPYCCGSTRPSIGDDR